MAQTYATGASDKMQTSVERLSSGLRINSAADDSAGLAVTNKMASQLQGIKMDNSIYTDKDRDNAEMENQALKPEVNKIVANKRFNDVSLLDRSCDQTVRAGNTNA